MISGSHGIPLRRNSIPFLNFQRLMDLHKSATAHVQAILMSFNIHDVANGSWMWSSQKLMQHRLGECKFRCCTRPPIGWYAPSQSVHINTSQVFPWLPSSGKWRWLKTYGVDVVGTGGFPVVSKFFVLCRQGWKLNGPECCMSCGWVLVAV